MLAGGAGNRGGVSPWKLAAVMAGWSYLLFGADASVLASTASHSGWPHSIQPAAPPTVCRGVALSANDVQYGIRHRASPRPTKLIVGYDSATAAPLYFTTLASSNQAKSIATDDRGYV